MGQWRAVVDIPATPQGPATARRVVDAVLPAWDYDDLRFDAELVVSELVTNAVMHAPGADTLELELIRRESGLRIALADGSAVRPIIKELSEEHTSGRGMVIVQAVASAWGSEEQPGGKRVWVDIDRPS